MTTVITGPNDGLVQGKNLSTKYVGVNPDTFEVEVVVDEKTIKHDGSAYYVDSTELDIVSGDKGNLIVEGSDLGAFLEKDTITGLIDQELGRVVARNDDNIALVNGMLTTVFKGVSEIDGDSIDFSMANNEGNWTLTGEVIASPDRDNLVEVRENGVYAEMPDEAVTYDSATGQLMVNGTPINNWIQTAPNPDIGKMYVKAIDYNTAATTGSTEYLDVAPEGVYTGHIQIRSLARTSAQMDDTYAKMVSNGGTTASGFPAYLGELEPTPNIGRASAASVFSVKSNGIDPVEVLINCDDTFKGYILCTLIRIA